ncbi:TadE/TadG family type IV pilus assembly protein [Aliamphritea spongicola]|uniref:TadE/TadG family type IV pilus assembly protein n=1 Tax=Aliamphritea spongicola TaxID=707589 RepID=UPI00196A2096|nr:TadE/TadG family type IV pilus assembly protein [Aliamphritea spongicola]MBN3562851.1 pilus assembly protein [Aliamphritea spongicola]
MIKELRNPSKSKGLATVEMVFIIPVLLLLGLGVIELSHAIQAKNISTALAREGANLASRSTVDSDQQIMDALALSADPLDFSQEGIIYISVIVGDDDPDPYVSEQHRWLNHGISSLSETWSDCPSWQGDGTCSVPTPKPRLSNFPITLEPGETVHVVEIVYDYSWLTRYLTDQNLLIYSRAFM